MEVSLQPSFTFPSRKVYANRALGLQAQINLQQLTSVPKRATDISLETALEPTLTVPKTLDKDVFDVKPVLPVTTPIYVQPALAEGLSNVAANQEFDKMILTTVSANNALKRGNFKAAENILGRGLTAEEIQNGTVTPQARMTENGEKVHVGNHALAVGTKLNSGPSRHQQEMAIRTASLPFLNDLAAKMGMTVEDLNRIKFGNQYIGELDFSQYGRSTNVEEKAAILKRLVDYMRHNGHYTAEEQKQESERNWEMHRANIFNHDQNMRYQAEARARQEAEYRTALNLEQGIDSERKQDEEMHQRDEEDDDVRGNSLNPLQQFQDDQGYMPIDDNVHEGVRDVAQVNVQLPSTEQLRATYTDVFYGRGRAMDDETRRRTLLLLEEQMRMREVLDAQEAAPVAPDVNMSNEDVAAAVLGAPAGSGRSFQDELAEAAAKIREKRDRQDVAMTIEEKLAEERRYKRKAERPFEDELKESVKRRRLRIGEPEDEMGSGFGKRNHRKKRKNIRRPIDDRWVPDAESYFGRGAPVSGNYMRKTGTDAIAISAQLQVPNTHQFTELPVRKFTQFPNMDSETKTDVIPISQNADRGVAAHRGKINFGKYRLDHSKLMGEGVLSLSHPNGRKVHGFPNQRVSKGVHHALSEIVAGGKVNPRKLASEDKAFLTDLLRRSHASVPTIGADVNMPPEEQLQLILGEMTAGNDSALLKGQLRKLLPYMVRMKMITAGHMADIKQHYL
jgi:hypothetical protein